MWPCDVFLPVWCGRWLVWCGRWSALCVTVMWSAIGRECDCIVWWCHFSRWQWRRVNHKLSLSQGDSSDPYTTNIYKATYFLCISHYRKILCTVPEENQLQEVFKTPHLCSASSCKMAESILQCWKSKQHLECMSTAATLWRESQS